MSNEIVRAQRQAIERSREGGLLPSRVPRGVMRRVDTAVADGLVAATRVQAAAYVTDVALMQVAMLSAQEFRLPELSGAQDPMQAAIVASRAKTLVDTFTVLARAEIANLA